MIAPGLYFISSPIIAIIALFMFSAFMVYVVVPVAALAGIYFNDSAREQKKRTGLKKKAKEVLEATLIQQGLTLDDLEDACW